MPQVAAERDDPSCRIYAILARDGRSAVVFRRGPSKRVLVLRWWLDDDRIEAGQWFVGRLHERDCDLSPDGELLIYHAVRHKGVLPQWTAISRPPYLTALVLWECYRTGGGVFDGLRSARVGNFIKEPALRAPARVLVQYPEDELRQHIQVWREPGDLYLSPSTFAAPEEQRMDRDGWRQVQEGTRQAYRSSGPIQWPYDPTHIDERAAPASTDRRHPLLLRRVVRGISQIEGPLRVEDFEVAKADGTVVRRLADCSWADWQGTGDLLFSLDGRLYRVSRRDVSTPAKDPLQDTKCIADLNAMKFEKRKPPGFALQWP